MARVLIAVLQVPADQPEYIRLPFRTQVQEGGEQQQVRTVPFEQGDVTQARSPAGKDFHSRPTRSTVKWSVRTGRGESSTVNTSNRQTAS